VEAEVEANAPDDKEETLARRCCTGTWAYFVILWQGGMVLWMFLECKFADSMWDSTQSQTAMGNYRFFIDVQVMLFLGYGYLLSFLRKYGFSAIAFNLLMAVLAIQWYILTGKIIHKLVAGHDAIEYKIEVNLATVLSGEFAAGAVLISAGAMLGKASFPQLMIVTFFEVMIFAANEAVNLEQYKAVDVGRSMTVHAFGAYFGLAAGWAISPRHAHKAENNSTSGISVLFAMIGTLFLFCYWPSWNSASATPGEQQRCVVVTVLALCASAVTSMICSYILRSGKIHMGDVQNATLAGGVGIGSMCNLAVGIGGSLTAGAGAGALSAIGTRFIQPVLEACGIADTAGVHNLHGMPGLFSGLGAILVAWIADSGDYNGAANLQTAYPARFVTISGTTYEDRTAADQAAKQALFLATTIGIAIVGGLCTGLVARLLAPGAGKLFDDANHFDVPSLDDADEKLEKTITKLIDEGLRQRNIFKAEDSDSDEA
jgi:ammonium transporter Rh